jgi:hypothetical protein
MTNDVISRQRTLLRELALLVSRRTAAEPELERNHRSRKSAEALEFEEAYQTTIVRFASDKEATDQQAQEARETSKARFEAERDAAAREHAESVRKYTARYQRHKEAAKTEFQEARWGIDAELEGNRQAAKDKLREDEKRVADKIERLQTIRQQARDLLTRWGRSPDALEEGVVYPPVGEGRPKLRNLQECLAVAEQGLYRLQTMIIPGLLRGGRLVFLFIVIWLSLVYPLGELARYVLHLPEDTTLAGVLLLGLAASTIVSLIAGFSIGGTLATLARRRIRKAYRPLCQAVLDADVSREHILTTFRTRCRRQMREHKKRHHAELRQMFDKYRKQRKEIKRRFRGKERQTEERYRQRREANDKRHAEEQRQAEEHHQRRRDEIQRRFDEESKYLQTAHQRHLEEIKSWYERERQTLVKSWHQGLAHLQKQAAAINQEVAALFPGWNDPRWQQWQPNREVPAASRFGSFRVSLEQFPGGVPEDEQLKPATPVDFTLPALAPLAVHSSMMLEAGEKGRDEAVDTLQMLMFRLLTSIPPAKVRFTIIDPVGLGQNFAAFMHLADYDESLVASRIWTESAHIEQRLADLTAHMENVIQKYLRNQYQTITEYNAQAGEVAEPFRILVVANFPVNFSVEAIRRLVSIVQSGPRCGISALISVDTRQPLQPGFDLADLEANAVTLVHDGGFAWKDDDFGRFPLLLDPPPGDELCNRLLHEVGTKAREAARVEVPFEFVAPPPDQWWTGDSRTGLTVALGRAGATKRQQMSLGRGTSQHVLVAGKTGSGKSTLLHVLITNLALLYSPDEVELYLIDFKKGVEFKAYAALGLPHARVIAIESEREFGLSVLQRLDAELKARGDRFRDAGAQDLNAYRTAHPDVHMPRILLLVDEFQEFFTEDDRISQDAAQLLDRLVRQGRAFGLHVLLGSQTLGGAYTLARSTIDQMAVRIALQCSEADAQLILSDDNSAARLLSRPGEAIYNDANGLVEGNDPFQVVWLNDDRRETYLNRIRELDRRRRATQARSASDGTSPIGNGNALPPPVVFEGNADAEPTKNHLLRGLLEARDWPAPARSCLAWLGEAIAIKDPTAATFRRQSSSNLLIVGQQDEAALGILSVALVGLAAQIAPDGGARFCVVDGSPADAPHAGFLGRLPAVLPHALRVYSWREVPALMAELSAELERRQKASDEEAPPVYLLLYGLQRLRDLRKQEDDFSFMRKADEAPSPAQQFATLLREGSGLGMHTTLWCDTLNNLQRSLDRQTLREFEMRLLFQMSVSDSSNLIDTPAAGKLGMHRALYYSEEEGRLEKFRPYGLPSAEWLEWVRQQLHGRTSTALAGS